MNKAVRNNIDIMFTIPQTSKVVHNNYGKKAQKRNVITTNTFALNQAQHTLAGLIKKII